MKYLVLLLALVCLGTSAARVVVTEEVRSLRGEYEQRQVVIKEDASYRQLNNKFINALANAAAAGNDGAIRDMLASEGVTYKLEPPAAPVAKAEEGVSDE